jgi:DNA replication protein DnaD
VERTLKGLAQIYSLPIVEMAMVEALFREKTALRDVLKILRHWRNQGVVKISYSQYFYEQIKEQCAEAAGEE